MSSDHQEPGLNGAQPPPEIHGRSTWEEQAEKRLYQRDRAVPARDVIRFDRIDSIAFEPLRPVIHGYLHEETINNFIGASGVCKSFLAIGVACSVSTRTPWYDQDVEQGAVFYAAGEGRRQILKRFEGWSRHHGVSLDGAPIYLSDGLPPLHDLVNAAAVLEVMKRLADNLFFQSGGIDPRLIVIDTIARALAGADENSASDVGRLVEAMDWLKSQWPAAVLGVHHTGHGADTKSRGRGSSALYAGLDGEYLVTSDGGQVRLRATKAKDWSEPPELFLDRHRVEWTVDGKPESTLVLVPASACVLSPAEMRERVAELRGQGHPTRVIAAMLGTSKTTVDRHVQAMRYEEQSNGR